MRWARGVLVSVALGVLRACSVSESPSDSETHFLQGCASDCGDLQCICGVCTRPCEPSCSALSDVASCRGAESGQPPTCDDGTQAAAAFCDVACRADADCSRVSSSLTCEGGYCRSGPATAASAPDASNGALSPDASLSLGFRRDASPPPPEPSDAGPLGASNLR
jgi:hypothetical protein